MPSSVLGPGAATRSDVTRSFANVASTGAPATTTTLAATVSTQVGIGTITVVSANAPQRTRNAPTPSFRYSGPMLESVMDVAFASHSGRAAAVSRWHAAKVVVASSRSAFRMSEYACK